MHSPRSIHHLSICASLVVAIGCSKHGQDSAKSANARAAAAKLEAQTAPQNDEAANANGDKPAQRGASAEHGSKKKKGIDIPVYVDGKQLAVLRYGELPPSLQSRTDPENDSPLQRYFRLYEYLKAIGVPPASIQQVHITDRREKTISVLGSELVARKTGFLFDFMEGDTGVAKTHWSTQGLKDQLRIEEMQVISVFVKLAPPVIDRNKRCYMVDGACTSDVPYAGKEVAKGTRIYVDGELKGFVKRRTLGDELVMGRTEDGGYKFSLAKFAETVGVDQRSIKAVRLVNGDNVVAQFDQSTWSQTKDSFAFTLGQHQHGKAKILLAADYQAKGEDPVKDETIELTSVQFFKNARPRPMKLTPVGDLDPETPTADSVEDPHQD